MNCLGITLIASYMNFGMNANFCFISELNYRLRVVFVDGFQGGGAGSEVDGIGVQGGEPGGEEIDDFGAGADEVGHVAAQPVLVSLGG